MGLVYSIGTKNGNELMNKELETQISSMKEQGLIMDKTMKTIGKYYFYELILPDDYNSKSRRYCITSLTSALTNLIVDKYKDIVIYQTIKNHYYYFNIEERKAIGEKTAIYLQDIPEMQYHKEWKKRVSKRIIKHLETNNNLIIDGFVNFRLKDFCNEIQLAVEDSVEDYILEKEYDEFVDLLKHLINITKSKFENVHIFFTSSGSFKLYDEDMQGIQFYNYGINLMDEHINYEDVLISSLVTFAPKNLILHNFKLTDYHTLITTLKKVFGEKNVIKCKGCSKCSNSYSENN
ncbi:MAG: hypothetical protein APF76_09470 [Desulfitibacter sp. BRH_c19]|nr:MAG: hypothetical protein APF76_09470 [Desulfitibacter sp. BRH_c19]